MKTERERARECVCVYIHVCVACRHMVMIYRDREYVSSGYSAAEVVRGGLGRCRVEQSKPEAPPLHRLSYCRALSSSS